MRTKTKKTNKLLSIFLAFLMVLSLIVSSVLQFSYADETLKLDLAILTDLKSEAEAKKVYWTGESINAYADLNVSGTGVSIDNAKTVITVPKVKYNDKVVIAKPTFVKSATAASWQVNEDDDNYYAIYNFNTLKGGQQITIPFPFSFKNDITPGGINVTPTYEIFDGDGNSLKKANITYTSQVTSWKSDKWIWYAPHMHDRTNEDNGEHVEAVRRGEYRDVKAPETTPAEGWDVQYALELRPNDGHSTLGKYIPDRVKIVEKLPQGAEISPRSQKEGWVYDPASHTATYEGKLEKTDWNTGGETRLRKFFYVTFKNYPVYLNQTGQRNVPGEFVFKNKADFYINPDTPQEEKLEEKYANGVFEVYETKTPPRPPFSKSESFRFDAWGSTDNDNYTGFYNATTKEFTREAVHFNSRITQINNGSSYETPDEDGYKREIKRISWDMDEKLYIKFYTPFLAGNHLHSGDTLRKNEELKEQYNRIGKKLYGIKKDGSKELIDSEVTLGKRVDLNDTEHKYVSVTLEFDEPLILDNSGFNLQIEGYPDKEEKAKFDDGTYKTNQTYYLWMNVDAKRVDEAEFTHFTKNNETYTHQNFSLIKMPAPRIEFYNTEGNHTVPYGDDNVRTIKVGPRFAGNWTGMEQRQKLKQITLLPSGIVFKEHKKVDWADPKYRNVEPTIIENFRNTGKTAVIYEYELNRDGRDYDYFRANFDVEATIYANSGNNTLEHYIVWDENDIVKPNNSAYKDALDLDGDGNFDEIFMKTTTNINFIPPLEVIAKKTVALQPIQGGLVAPSQDIGKPVYYHINILNNSIKGLTTLSIIDVLPYVGDHKIAPNESGLYLPRNSQFNMNLTNSVESVPENARVLERFDVYYSLTKQGEDLASVRDAQWVRADEITDFSKIKNVKFVLKEGAILNSKEEVGFFLPSAIPYDENLETGSVSKNSVAFSTNNFDYIEANEATASNVKYSVEGVMFFDKNRSGENNGKLNDDDVKLSGYEVQLMNEDGSPYLDRYNKPVKAVTDENGHYFINVYERGKYFIQFTKKDSGEVFTQVYSKIGKGGNDATQNDTDELKGITPVFSLDPVSTHAVRNGGILLSKGQIIVKKTNENGAALSGVKFKLKDKNTDFEIELTTDDKGEARFEELRFSDYTLTETETLPSYVLDKSIENVQLTQEDSIKNYTKENRLKRGSLILTKVDGDDNNKKLENVSFGLYQSGSDQPLYSARTNSDGIATFENIPYGTYELKERTTVMGYVLRTDVIKTVSITEDGQREVIDRVINNKIKADVTITKVDADNQEKKLEGVVFAVYNTENNQEVTTATTDENGVATFEKLSYGSYYIKEKSTIEGYILSDVRKDINIASEQTIDLGSVTNEKIKGDISFTKVDGDEQNKKLEGIEFGLYKYGKNNEEIEILSAFSDEDGIVSFENVEYGDYFIKEKATIEGYVLSEDKHEVSIKSNREKISLGNIVNNKIKADVSITKVDAEDNNKKLEGVVFELLQDDEVKYTATTNEDGIATFESVVYGSYKLVEKSTLENYNLSDVKRDIKVENTADINLGNFTNQIKKGSVKVTKVDKEDETKKLSGVTFVLTQDDREIYEAVTSEDGVATFEDVAYGKYTLKEKATLENYNLSKEEREVNIDEDGKIVELGDFTNKIKKGNIRIIKVDETSKKLSGVEFEILKDGKSIEKKLTDEKGEVVFENLVYGDYEVVESKALDGYFKNDRVYDFRVRDEGSTLTQVVVNKEKPVKRVNTGDENDSGMTISLLGLSLLMILASGRRKNE